MKIKIYKPHFDVTYNNSDNSSPIFINPEISSLAKILAKKHEVILVSPSDFKNNTNPRAGMLTEKSDINILCEGRLYLKGDDSDERVNRELKEIKEMCNTGKNFRFITDYKIFKKNGDVLKDIDFTNITQSPNVGIYGELEKIFLYGENYVENHKKTNDIIYCGNSRGNARDEKICEYLINSGVDYSLFGNWDPQRFPKTKGKIPFKDCRNEIAKHKYSLVISEKLYEDINWFTPRLMESILANSIAFIDKDYPRNLSDFPCTDFQVVSSGRELKDKITFLESCPSFYSQLLKKQQEILNSGWFDGSYQLKILEKILA